jgi:hypothetical protein
VQSHEPIRPAALLGEAVDRQRRRRRREDRVVGQQLVQLAEQLDLGVVVLDDRLDDEAAVGEVVQLGRYDVVGVDLAARLVRRPVGARPEGDAAAGVGELREAECDGAAPEDAQLLWVGLFCGMVRALTLGGAPAQGAVNRPDR